MNIMIISLFSLVTEGTAMSTIVSTTIVARTIESFPESPRRRRSTIDRDAVRHSARRGKVATMLTFCRRYRDCCAAVAAAEWRGFHESGRFGGSAGRRFEDTCGAAAAEVAREQVIALLSRFVSHRQNEFRRAVSRSTLDPTIKRILYFINVRQAWHVRGDLTWPGTGEVVGADLRRLALSIWRPLRKHRHRPDARSVVPVLDERLAGISASRTRHADLWATFAFAGQEAFSIPLHNARRAAPPRDGGDDGRGRRIEIVPRGRNFAVRLIT